MADIPMYELPRDMLARIASALQNESLTAHPVGPPVKHLEGVDQSWDCADESGLLFKFATCEGNSDKIIPKGMILLIMGPITRKKAPKDVFTRFDRALLQLGARRVSGKSPE